ncbi:MAG TPA: hypothetical protein VHL77_12835 [Ferruginibacter sp.]|nr:hypothetical protein [Ferruginibacter sp.]
MMAGIRASSNFTITPKQISNLALWYDGQDPSGNNSPPANGSSVATWVDKSASAINIAQAAGGQQMTYQTNVINGRAAMLGSNAAQKYYLSANTITLFDGLNSYYLFVVTRPTSTANNIALFNAYDASNFGIYAVPKTAGPLLTQLNHIVSGGSDITNTGNNSWTSNTNYLIQFSRDGGAASTQSITMSNGASGTLNPLVRGALPTSNKTIAIPTNGAGPLGNTLTGYCGEETFYTRMLTTTEISILTNYTKLKWGI